MIRWNVVALLALSLLGASCSAGGLAPEATTGDQRTAEQPGSDETAVPSSVEAPAAEVSPPPEPALVYISVGNDNRLVGLQLETNGNLTLRDDRALSLPGPAGAMTYSAADRRLYVGSGNNISTVQLDDSGVPTLLGTAPVDGEPVYLDLAADDRVLAVAYFGEDEVRAYTIGDDPDALPILQADRWDIEPHAIVFNREHTRAYVPHRNANSIGVYDVDETGTLSQIGRVAEVGPGPRHLVLSPDGRFAFVVNEQGDSVTGYTVQADGNLTENNELSTIPEGFDPESNTGADIHITPDGRYVYASNRGHDSIAMFEVDQNGRLVSLGQVPTQQRPRDFGMSPDGRHIVVAGQDSGTVESFVIGDDGQLTSVAVVPVGDGPVWVEII